jgi:hypothetical protein
MERRATIHSSCPFGEHHADQPDHRLAAREDADHIGAPADLPVSSVPAGLLDQI